ncbi:redox-regulated ATPase YchF [Candidatus Giovannonibacteria bacterium]|nr:redox-regulated ATPase YchF [Candidatus Giovannonibacteria bacterium]
MKIGIVGLPNVGKSTLFQALTKKQVDTSNYPFATIDPNVGVVSVPDERLYKLTELSKSKKIVPAIVEFVDIAGLVKGAAAGEGLGNKFLTHIREVNTVCHIVRAFENENIVHVSGKPNPLSDLETIKTELALKDLETVAKARENAHRDAKSGKKEATQLVQYLEEIEKLLQDPEKLGTFSEVSEEITKTANSLQLLSFKPSLTVFNISSKDNLPLPDIPNSLPIDIGQENDIASMSEEEKKELGLVSELPQLIKAAYKLLGLMTFFTTGEDESRAWTIPQGSTAKRAGRAIHSDFEDKFIRADIIFWEKLLEAGSWSKARDLGWLRSEGKEYIVKDGDVIEFKI